MIYAEDLSPREINRLHIRVMGAVRRKIALEVQGMALVGIACTAGDKAGHLPAWLERMGAPPVIRKISDIPTNEEEDVTEEDAVMDAAMKVALQHMRGVQSTAGLGAGMVD